MNLAVANRLASAAQPVKLTLNNHLRCLHISVANQKNQVGRYRVTPKKDFPLTYEMSNPPHEIAHRKAWNSWNTTNVEGGLRPAETAVEDVFIRRFMTGIIHRGISSRKLYFLIGYTEELLSSWLQCPVKLELQTVSDKRDVIHKYV